MKPREQGWECPKCQRVWAPKINACGYCNTMLIPPAASPTLTQPPLCGKAIW